MHWELEFADLFAERGGFDLIIGNPPWIKIIWEEFGVLSDANPVFSVKKLTASQVANARKSELDNAITRGTYIDEYIVISGQQNYLRANQNYKCLQGGVNLYKCFLPQSWAFSNEKGIFAFVHPDGVYDDPNGGELRKIFTPK